MRMNRFLILMAIFVLAAGAYAQEGGRPFRIALTGAAEVPGPGDPDGSGKATITLNQGKGEVCYEITVADIADPTMAHIHEGAEGAAGPPVVTLFAEGSATLTGCVSVDAELIKRIRQDPTAFYVNVHNAEFPDGAVRGQLDKKKPKE